MRKAFLLALLCCSTGALADAYKCMRDGKTVYSQHPCGDDAVTVGSRLTVPLGSAPHSSVTRTGSSLLVLSLDGRLSYMVDGTVKGVPVRFVVDTGATVTSIPSNLAVQAGIYECRRIKMHTANGIVQACGAMASEITFGNFRVTNLEVAVMPFSGEPLLGMNVLRHFKVEQQPGGAMTISR